MATKTIVIDDLDGSEGADTVEFGFDGVQYTIDLSRKNKAAFQKAIKVYVDAARTSASRSGNGRTSNRRTSDGRKRASGRGARTTTPDLATVRAWAVDNGYEVAARGRVAQSVIDAYQAAQQ